eukprot:6585600-Alexandrium_andersonii.AAC.1
MSLALGPGHTLVPSPSSSRQEPQAPCWHCGTAGRAKVDYTFGLCQAVSEGFQRSNVIRASLRQWPRWFEYPGIP